MTQFYLDKFNTFYKERQAQKVTKKPAKKSTKQDKAIPALS